MPELERKFAHLGLPWINSCLDLAYFPLLSTSQGSVRKGKRKFQVVFFMSRLLCLLGATLLNQISLCSLSPHPKATTLESFNNTSQDSELLKVGEAQL